MGFEQQLEVLLVRVGDIETAVPHYASGGAAGMDLAAALPTALTLAPGARALIPTGWAMAVPEGYEAQVRPRSGLALRHGVTVLNSPGTVDSDYRGEVKVLLANFGQEPFVVQPGDRVAQLVLCPVVHARLRVTTELGETARGAGGYGSTGVSTAVK